MEAVASKWSQWTVYNRETIGAGEDGDGEGSGQPGVRRCGQPDDGRGAVAGRKPRRKTRGATVTHGPPRHGAAAQSEDWPGPTGHSQQRSWDDGPGRRLLRSRRPHSAGTGARAGQEPATGRVAGGSTDPHTPPVACGKRIRSLYVEPAYDIPGSSLTVRDQSCRPRNASPERRPSPRARGTGVEAATHGIHVGAIPATAGRTVPLPVHAGVCPGTIPAQAGSSSSRRPPVR